MRSIAYKGGYKYQLKESYVLALGIAPPLPIETDFIQFDAHGNLHIAKGYAWDGPSGPAPDIRSFMRASLVHDALYQLMREGHLDHHAYRDRADRILQRLCKEDGMWRPAAWLAYQFVHGFADPFADPAHRRPVKRAPRQ